MKQYTNLPYQFNGDKLSKELMEKRLIHKPTKTYLSLEKTANIVGCSRVTIDRASKGKVVDAVTLYAICEWIEMPMKSFFIKSKK